MREWEPKVAMFVGQRAREEGPTQRKYSEIYGGYSEVPVSEETTPLTRERTIERIRESTAHHTHRAIKEPVPPS